MKKNEFSGNGDLKQERAVVTRAAILKAARELFGRFGYHGTGITEVVERAGVTRGSLYYHFSEKRDLFESVFAEIDEELSQATIKAVRHTENDIWLHFVEAMKYKLAITSSGAEQKIILVDALAVLGWERLNEIQATVGFASTVEQLSSMMSRGIVKRLDARIVAKLVLVALNEASLTVVHAEKPKAALKAATDALVALLQGLKTAP